MKWTSIRRSCWLFLNRTSRSSSPVGHPRVMGFANVYCAGGPWITVARLLTTLTFCSTLEQIRTPSFHHLHAPLKCKGMNSNRSGGQVISWQVAAGGFVSKRINSDRWGGQICIITILPKRCCLQTLSHWLTVVVSQYNIIITITTSSMPQIHSFRPSKVTTLAPASLSSSFRC